MSWSVCTKDVVIMMCTTLLIEWGAFVRRKWDRKKWLLEVNYLGIGLERGQRRACEWDGFWCSCLLGGAHNGLATGKPTPDSTLSPHARQCRP